MAIRGKGEGCVRQRRDGTWEARIDVGRNPSGKRVTKSLYGKTKKEVTDALTNLAKQKLDGMLLMDQKLTVGDFLDRWLASRVKTTTRAATHASYSQNVRLHIKPAVGSIMLSKLSPLHVQDLYSKMEEQKKSPRMRQMIHAILRRALQSAVKWGLVPRNVCDAVDRPRAPKHEIQALTVDQVSRLLSAAESYELYPLILMAILSGLRQGELLGLEWADIDLKAKTVQVRRTIVDLNGEVTVSPPKTAKGQRLVTLPQTAIDALWAHRSRLMAKGLAKCPLVFPANDGGYQRRHGPVRWDFKEILKRAELPEIRFHDLRHSCATLLLEGGVHPKVVQERLGHSTIGITMDTYSHVMQTMQLDAANKLDGLFRKTS